MSRGADVLSSLSLFVNLVVSSMVHKFVCFARPFPQVSVIPGGVFLGCSLGGIVSSFPAITFASTGGYWPLWLPLLLAQIVTISYTGGTSLRDVISSCYFNCGSKTTHKSIL